jgi:hypothetical protein
MSAITDTKMLCRDQFCVSTTWPSRPKEPTFGCWAYTSPTCRRHCQPRFLHGGTGEDRDGRSPSSAAEAMLRVFFEGVLRVIYGSLYVGLSDVWHNFGEAFFLPSTSEIRETTISTSARHLIFHREDSVRDPQTLVTLESWRSQLSPCVVLVRGSHWLVH